MGQNTESNNGNNDKQTESNAQHKHNERYGHLKLSFIFSL